MQNPSDGVAPQLLCYIHLTSTQRFPLLAQLQTDQAVNYLLQAPRIVKDACPVVWQIINPPPDGTVLLTWQSPRMGKNMASDGYIWADPESTFHIEHEGLQIEIMVHKAGFQAGREQVALHQRKRYRILSKLPSDQRDIDPNLWLTHYSASEPQFRYPVTQIPPKPEYAQMMRDRQYLQERGQLLRKEFMLHDRTNWPTIPFPGGQPMGQQPGMPMQPPTPGYPPGHPLAQAQQAMRQPGFYPPQQPAQPTPGPQAKRQRVNPPARMPTGPASVAPSALELAIEDEENTAIGDYMDHLTPREISNQRYKQHHSWMEEIVSSNYSTSQIAPESLGLGLAGDLADLTAGILDSPEMIEAAQERPGTAGGPNGATSSSVTTQAYKPLDSTQREELEKRIQAFTEKGKADLQSTKDEHARTLADFKRARQYAAAERALRNISAADSEGFQKAVADIQQRSGLSFSQRMDVICVQKEGAAVKPPRDTEKENLDAIFAKYKNKTDARRAGINTNTPLGNVSVNTSYGHMNNGHNASNSNGHDMMMPEDSASALLNQYVTGGGSSSGTPGSFNGFQNRSMPQSNVGTPSNLMHVGSPTSTSQQQHTTPAAVAGAVPPPLQDQGSMQSTLAQGPHVTSNLGVSENMDVDVPSVAPFADPVPAVQNQAAPIPSTQSTAPNNAPPPSGITTTAIPDPVVPSAVPSVEQTVPTGQDTSAMPDITTNDINIDLEQPPSMFDDADLSNLNSAGDVLADLGGGDDLDIMAGMVGDGTEDGDDLGLDLGGLDDGDLGASFGSAADTSNSTS